ncbi:hypothetical protein EAH89_22315 [Roseomonas nepalensis]|uniref:Uncharacterized protein n=1 Tax=Muricoccus nepalensis TaxID=1854500 RepID=A0A502FHK5_9PROT|nr:hypothetical protein [Roseomonas nepalensis]TPG48925.1 hypothetical protein EAH89_22315 [Roseomonas nepalensis]
MKAADLEAAWAWDRLGPEQRTRWGRSVVASRIIDMSQAQGLTGPARDNFAMREWMSAYCLADERAKQDKEAQALSQSLWVHFIAVATRGFSVVEEFAREH